MHTAPLYGSARTSGIAGPAAATTKTQAMSENRRRCFAVLFAEPEPKPKTTKTTATKTTATKTTSSKAKSKTSEAIEPCPICQCELLHFNSADKSLHVNSCLDNPGNEEIKAELISYLHNPDTDNHVGNNESDNPDYSTWLQRTLEPSSVANASTVLACELCTMNIDCIHCSRCLEHIRCVACHNEERKRMTCCEICSAWCCSGK